MKKLFPHLPLSFATSNFFQVQPPN